MTRHRSIWTIGAVGAAAVVGFGVISSFAQSSAGEKSSADDRSALVATVDAYHGALQAQDTESALALLAPDVMVVVAYGLLLPQEVLDIPRLGCLNIHASLLPRWRGAAPIQRAILAGDTESGVAIMQMDAGLDTGDVLLMQSLPIQPSDTSRAGRL